VKLLNPKHTDFLEQSITQKVQEEDFVCKDGASFNFE